MDNHFKN